MKPRERLLAERFHQRFVITLKDGTAVAGLLIGVDAAVIALGNPEYLPRDSQAHPLKIDGQLLIERTNIAYMQAP